MRTRPGQRRWRYVETRDFLQMIGRQLRAASKRVAQADEEELAELFAVERMLDEILLEAVEGLRRSGATWDTIGQASGVTRQAAHKRWAHRIDDQGANGTVHS